MHEKMLHGPASDYVERVKRQASQIQPMKDRLETLEKQKQLCLKRIKDNNGSRHSFDSQLIKINKEIDIVNRTIRRMRHSFFGRACRPGLVCSV